VTPFGIPRLRAAVVTRFAAAACALGMATACADDGSNPSSDGLDLGAKSATGEQSGSLTIDLNPSGQVTFSSFSYAIVRPGFTKSGSIDVSQSTKVAATIAGLPPGIGYSLTLMGTSTAPVDAQCSGSAQFDIIAGHVTPVPVNLECHVNEVMPPVNAPLPPLVPVALGMLLAATGASSVRKRRKKAVSRSRIRSCKKHGGTLNVDCPATGGTAMTISLPRGAQL
jgi:hypothetical protein